MTRTPTATPLRNTKEKEAMGEQKQRRAWTRREGSACHIINGTIEIDICRNRRNNHFKPSPSDVKDFLNTHDPLPIRIVFTERSLDADTPKKLDRRLLQNYFDLFLDLLPRWKAARFWAPYVPWESFQERQFAPAPLLEYVALDGPADFDVVLVSNMLSVCWTTSPSFRKFELIQFNEGTILSSVPGNPSLPLPIATLSSLRLDCKISLWHCCDVLAVASGLKECSFGNVTSSDVYVGHRFENVALQTLKIGINFEDHDIGKPTFLWRLFEFFKAPALRQLSISRDDFWSTEHFIAFLQNSACPLEALEFFMVKTSELELFQILQHTPFLHILRIFGDSSQDPQPITDKLIFSLTKCPQNVNLLCPDLEMFAVNDDAVEYLQDGALSKMLLSRINGAHVEYFWFEAERDNARHKFDIETLEGMTGQLKILETLVVGSSRESQEDWDIAVEKRLAEQPSPRDVEMDVDSDYETS